MEDKTITEWFITREALLNSDHISWSQKVFIKEGFYIPNDKSGSIHLNDILLVYKDFLKISYFLHCDLMTKTHFFFNGESSVTLKHLIEEPSKEIIHFYKMLYNENCFLKSEWSTWMKFVEGVPELVEYLNYPY